jgi:peroxiredoxin
LSETLENGGRLPARTVGVTRSGRGIGNLSGSFDQDQPAWLALLSIILEGKGMEKARTSVSTDCPVEHGTSSKPNIKTMKRTRSILWWLLLVAVVGLNLLLLKQNRDLKILIAKSPREAVVKPGQVLPALHGKTINGESLTVSYGNDTRKTVLLVFSPGCDFCSQNMPNWHKIMRSLDPSAYRVVALSTRSDGSRQYLETYGLNAIPAITELDPKDRVSYELNITPETILIDSAGKVEAVWAGVFGEAERQQIKEMLGVDLSVSN